MHERDAVLEARRADGLLEIRPHVGVDVEADDAELRPPGQLDREVPRPAADVDARARANPAALAEHSHGGLGVGVSDAVFDDPLVGRGAVLARDDQVPGLGPQAVSGRAAGERDEFLCRGRLAHGGGEDRLAGRLDPGDLRNARELCRRRLGLRRRGQSEHGVEALRPLDNGGLDLGNRREPQFDRDLRAAGILGRELADRLFQPLVGQDAAGRTRRYRRWLAFRRH